MASHTVTPELKEDIHDKGTHAVSVCVCVTPRTHVFSDQIRGCREDHTQKRLERCIVSRDGLFFKIGVVRTDPDEGACAQAPAPALPPASPAPICLVAPHADTLRCTRTRTKASHAHAHSTLWNLPAGGHGTREEERKGMEGKSEQSAANRRRFLLQTPPPTRTRPP